MAFPAFSRAPSFPLSPDGETEPNVISSESEAGYEQTRARATRMPKLWGLNYKLTKRADYDLLVAWQPTAHAVAVSWTHPISGVTYTVRVKDKISISNTAKNIWVVSFLLKEVL